MYLSDNRPRLFRQHCTSSSGYPCASLSGKCLGTGNRSDYPNEAAVRDLCVDTNPYSVVYEKHVCLGLSLSSGQRSTIQECQANCDSIPECHFIEFATTTNNDRCNHDMDRCRCNLVLQKTCAKDDNTIGIYKSLKKNVVKNAFASYVPYKYDGGDLATGYDAQGLFGCWGGMQSNIGLKCWDRCGQKSGLCHTFCGATGLCCKPGGTGTDCTDSDGGNSTYECRAPSACVAGSTWSATGNAPCSACAATSTCATGVKSACTKTTNTECHVACVAGATWSATGNAPCSACAATSTCATGVESACIPGANIVCNGAVPPCVGGKNFSGNGREPCEPCTADSTCKSGVKTSCSTTTDTVCE